MVSQAERSSSSTSLPVVPFPVFGNDEGQEEAGAGHVQNFISECAGNNRQDPVVEFVLPDPDDCIGLPSDFDFSIAENHFNAPRTTSRSWMEARPVAFVELGRNVDAFAQLAAKKRDEAIGACIDSALEMLLREAPGQYERRDVVGEASAAAPDPHFDAWTNVLRRLEDTDPLIAASGAGIRLGSLPASPKEAGHRSPPASPLVVSRALAAAIVAAAVGKKTLPSAPPSPLAESRITLEPQPEPQPEELEMAEPLQAPSRTPGCTLPAHVSRVSPFQLPSREMTILDEVETDWVCCEDEMRLYGDEPAVVRDTVRMFSARPGRSMFPQTFLAYMPGDSVEYFSTTHQRWIHGTATVRMHEDATMTSYSVHIGAAGQLRENVCLESLREPLQDGEAVEFLAPRRSDWVPARIHGPQVAGATQSGYRVRLEGSPGIIRTVPAERLRRRFPSNHQVEFYKGPTAGWRNATMHPGADHLQPRQPMAQRTPSRPCSIPCADEKSDSLATAGPSGGVPRGRIFSIDGPFSDELLEPEAESNLDIEHWKLVPLCREEGASSLPLWVPSYLLRFPKMDRDQHMQSSSGL